MITAFIIGSLHSFFALLGNHPIVFLLLSLALGYPLGKVSLARISLGSTAGTLLVGVLISLTARVAFNITYDIPSILSSVFLLLFMYALGLSVGPQFFSGLKSGGASLIVVSLIVWSLNWIINVAGAKLAGLAPGYSAGLISGSYTITAVMGVAQSAIQSGSVHLPAGMSADQAGANMAAGYAISYLLSSIGIIVLIRYLPQMFGHDPKADAKAAESAYTAGAKDPVPGGAGSLDLRFSDYDVRTYQVTNKAIIGKTPKEIFKDHHDISILRVTRGDDVENDVNDVILKEDDVVTVWGNVGVLIHGESKLIGPEVDHGSARNLPIKVADLRVKSQTHANHTLENLHKTIGFGVQFIALFRDGRQVSLESKPTLKVGDVLRISGSVNAIHDLAKKLVSKPIMQTITTEVPCLAFGMLAGYLAGIISVNVMGIPFALGDSTGCMLAGICISYIRSKNPEFGGPMDEGARLFLQDIGLNLFVAVLAANVGPKLLASFQGTTVIWLALIGTVSALLPCVIAYTVALKFFKMNSIIADGAVSGARNSTPGLQAIAEHSESSIAAAPFPLTYAITTVLALLGGYISMLIA